MNLSIIGTGYVGLITGITFAKYGHKVACVDVIQERIDQINKGEAPFFEPGMGEYLQNLVRTHSIWATMDTKKAVLESDVTFICVGTPQREDGSQDLTYIKSAAEDIGNALQDKEGFHLVVVKSTVEPTTTLEVVLPIIKEASGKIPQKDFSVAHNPEFLREGSAIEDSFNPDRIVMGVTDEMSEGMLMLLYEDFKCAKLTVDPTTSEMIKYTSNSFLATKISFSNEIGNICQELGLDVYQVFKGVALDHRINPFFFNAGCGFGGSCFPKDIHALIHVAEKKEVKTKLLDSVLDVNEKQPTKCVDLAKAALLDLKDKDIAVLGLAFKPGTDDVRETRALPIVQALIQEGAKVTGYDPQAVENFKELVPDIEYTDDVEVAIKNKDLLIIQSDWQEIRTLEPKVIKELMRTPIIIDGRRTLDQKELEEAGITYKAIGLGK
jgi:UDPglucose 6-dehydrogenase